MIEALVGLAFLFGLWVFGRSLLLASSADEYAWLAIPSDFAL